jgi:hypothetical protein
MASIMRLLQRFQLSKKKELMELERQFAALEDQGILPKGQRMLPIASHAPGNTLVWEGRFGNLHEAERSLHLFESHPAHVKLFPRRSPKTNYLRSLKVTHVGNTFADTVLNLFLHCERKLFCLHPLLEERVDSRQPIAHE